MQKPNVLATTPGLKFWLLAIFHEELRLLDELADFGTEIGKFEWLCANVKFLVFDSYLSLFMDGMF